MVSKFNNYVLDNIIDLSRRSTSLEGFVFSRLETQEILKRGISYLGGNGYHEVKALLNLNRAWGNLLVTSEKPSIDILQNFHSTISEGILNDPLLEGQFRTFTPIRISGTNYKPKVFTQQEAIKELNSMLSDLNTFILSTTSTKDKINYILGIYCFLMRQQYFLDCNKRTSYLFTNYLFKYYKLDCILWLPPLSKEDVFLSKLKVLYEDNNPRLLVNYLRRYYVKSI